ncbi:hypothetical protein L1077_27025 [Pseudoalteromonas luteoviolacea]|uniref:hypothetical protein n=1 Tax=Pseudoalteromonas luteoviolacea TaxID=43657 RepID=UPI001F1F53D3|nr:hypothetical protein [Pseudoalteromonas luteoviolacea]MCF6443084.1 hypothetical protein [Pseudoalteromonas luteoviolacea]
MVNLNDALEHNVELMKWMDQAATTNAFFKKAFEENSVISAMEQRLSNIKKAISIYGPEFNVPARDNEIPNDNADLFFGCWHWMSGEKVSCVENEKLEALCPVIDSLKTEVDFSVWDEELQVTVPFTEYIYDTFSINIKADNGLRIFINPLYSELLEFACIENDKVNKEVVQIEDLPAKITKLLSK